MSCPRAAAARGDQDLLFLFSLIAFEGLRGTLIGSSLLERGLDPFGECCRGTSPSALPQRSQGWCWHGGLEVSYSSSNCRCEGKLPYGLS